MDRTATDPMIGRVLEGRYRVESRVARGGMATVYEAVDLRLDRVCALKVMHAGLGDDDDFAGRFVREARAAARLSHPHVVGVFDQGADDGTLFLAMEFVPGHTLRDLIRAEAPLSPSRALSLLDPVLQALAAAHQAGLIHRDVKPENVLLADDGRVKVADFGLARAVSAETQHSTAGVLIGTVSYLSPELLVDGCADARSDVYAAGVVLYELLTGRKPHEAGSPIQVAYKHVHEDVPPPSRLVPGLPAYVDALVARATARDRDLRPSDAQVLLRHVRRVRVALDQHVADDPDLTSDLLPTVPVQRLGDTAPDPEPALPVDLAAPDVPTVLTPAQAAHQADRGTADPTTDPTTGLDTGRAARERSRPVQRSGAPAGPRPNPRPGPRPGRRRRRRGPLLLVLVLLLVVAVGAGSWWLGVGRYTTTPGVLKLSAASAAARVEAAGLGFDVAGRDYSETVPAGAVLRTDPAGGEHVLRHGTVTAVLSQGPERHRVPKLVRVTAATARAELAAASLSVGQTTARWSVAVPRGSVVTSTPVAGVPLRRSAAVDLVVSKGPPPVRVPDLTGDSATDAVKELRRLHLRVGVSRSHSDTVAEGDVISQDPATGTLSRGDTLLLEVSQGPVMVEVPRVVGHDTGDAEATLRAAGFEVTVEHVEYYIGLHVVVKESPGSGDLAPRGSTVTIGIV